jgi:hypothetical protein
MRPQSPNNDDLGKLCGEYLAKEVRSGNWQKLVFDGVDI